MRICAAVQSRPLNIAQILQDALALHQQGRLREAEKLYTRAIKADPGDHTSEGYLGCSLIQLGRAEEGLRWIQRAGSGTWSTCAAGATSIATSSR